MAVGQYCRQSSGVCSRMRPVRILPCLIKKHIFFFISNLKDGGQSIKKVTNNCYFPFPKKFCCFSFIFKTIIFHSSGCVVGTRLFFIFRIVPKYQKCPQITPESVFKNNQNCPQLITKKVTGNSVIYHYVRATLSD